MPPSDTPGAAEIEAADGYTLLACPFCGGEARIADIDDADGHGNAVECSQCLVSTRIHYACGDDPEPIVVGLWNGRSAATIATLTAERDEAIGNAQHAIHQAEQLTARADMLEAERALAHGRAGHHEERAIALAARVAELEAERDAAERRGLETAVSKIEHALSVRTVYGGHSAPNWAGEAATKLRDEFAAIRALAVKP